MNYLQKKKLAFMSIVNQIKHPLLPSEYQQVEYIEGTGTQYIDTEFYPYDKKYVMTAKIKSSVVPTITENKYYRIFGNLSAENPAETTLYRYQYRGFNDGTLITTDAVCCGTAVKGEAPALLIWQDYTDYEITVDGVDKTYSINGKTGTYQGTQATYISQYSIKLMTVSVTATRDIMKFYGFKIKDEVGNLLVDMYPCYRRSDNVMGMYDVVRNRFFTNAGTGTFLKGENV